MKSNPKEVEFEFNLPDFDKKDIDVKISKNLLAIRASKKQEKKTQKKDFFHYEKSSRSFAYSTTLPSINAKKAKTDFKKGVLKIIVPKE
jgi:HSP20 family protein